MKTSSHTPGPWIGCPNVIENEQLGYCKYIAIERDSPNYKFVAIAGGDTIREAEGNARLIAAAPELLEAAKECISTIEMLMGDKINPSASMSLASIQKAIQKAEGL